MAGGFVVIAGNAIAIVDSEIDINQLARSIQRAVIEYQDGERVLQAAERKTDGMRQEQQRRRLELGRQLIEAKRGVKHGGWLPYIEKLGVAPQTARDWMAEAGFVEESKNTANQDAVHLPTRVAAGIDKRPRRRDEEPDPPLAPPRRSTKDDDDVPVVETPSLHASWQRDIAKALTGIDKLIMGYAKSWPKRSRSDLARALRSVAERIERMDGE